MDVPMQVIDLHAKYHYYTMCTLQDMDLNQELNQSVTDRRMYGQGKHYVTSIYMAGHKN